MPQQTFLFKATWHPILYLPVFLISFLFKCISFRPSVHQRCNSLPTTSLFTTVQSDDDSWLDAGTKQFFDPAAGGSTHSSPLPYSWSPPLSEADLPYSSPHPYLVLPGDAQCSHSSHSSAPTAPTAVLPQLPQLPQLP